MINRILLISFLFFNLSLKQAFCGYDEDFKYKVKNLKWVAYSPTNFDPNRGIYPSDNSIREDLNLLYRYGFRGIVTYGSDKSLAQIPRLAYEVGFNGIIMGIWTINSQEEIDNAISASQYVDGYCVGNEGLNSRYDLETLRQVISKIKDSTNKPATTTEQISDYSNDNVFSVGDWIFPNIHPFLSEIKDPQKGAEWIEKHYQRLQKHCPSDKIILFKETGFPTAGMFKASELNQKDFFIALEKTGIPFVYFEAFDQPWKSHLPCEPYWGLFDHSRRPKQYISSL
jgi:exo-beta-1,3-glucanase (GH17 family)